MCCLAKDMPEEFKEDFYDSLLDLLPYDEFYNDKEEGWDTWAYYYLRLPEANGLVEVHGDSGKEMAENFWVKHGDEIKDEFAYNLKNDIENQEELKE